MVSSTTRSFWAPKARVRGWWEFDWSSKPFYMRMRSRPKLSSSLDPLGYRTRGKTPEIALMEDLINHAWSAESSRSPGSGPDQAGAAVGRDWLIVRSARSPQRPATATLRTNAV